jgi:hypothetical protein
MVCFRSRLSQSGSHQDVLVQTLYRRETDPGTAVPRIHPRAATIGSGSKIASHPRTVRGAEQCVGNVGLLHAVGNRATHPIPNHSSSAHNQFRLTPLITTSILSRRALGRFRYGPSARHLPRSINFHQGHSSTHSFNSRCPSIT